MKKMRNMYCFLDPADRHDQGINFIGNFVSLEPECEFLQLLEQWGAGPVRELFHCETYEDYQAMAKSCLAVGMRHVGDDVIHCMTDDLDIPYYYFPASYDINVVAKGYRKLAELLGQSEPDLGDFIQETEKEVEQTVKELRSMPLAIDCSAFLMPFQGAAALLKYGFQVRYIFYKPFMTEPDDRARQWVELHYPSVKLLRKDEYDHVNTLYDPECLAIGVDAARLLKTEKVADIWHDEGYFGFHGIRRLMHLLKDSSREQAERK